MNSVLVKACGATSWNVAAGQKRKVYLDLGLGVGVGLPNADCTHKSWLCVTNTCPSLPLFLHRWAMEREKNSCGRETVKGGGSQWESDAAPGRSRQKSAIDNIGKRGWPVQRTMSKRNMKEYLCMLWQLALLQVKKKLYYYVCVFLCVGAWMGG